MSVKLINANGLDRRVGIALALMRQSLGQKVTLELVAESVNLSASRLRHLFKEQTGMTPAQYIKSLRIREARELADETFLSVKQIRFRIGINDASHFSRDFKNVYGATVTGYRRGKRSNRPR